jgi:hypothetical protein
VIGCTIVPALGDMWRSKTADQGMGTGGGLVVIDFSEKGNSAYFRREGWSGQEPDRVWAVGPRSLLRIPIQSSGRAIILDAEIDPRREPPMVMGQLVRVGINGTDVGSVRINRPSMIRYKIDPEIAGREGVLDLEFAFPGFFRPDLLGASGDSRPVSGSFSFIRLFTTDMFTPGPHFPTSRPAIPVVSLSPPLAPAPSGNGTVVPATYTFGQNGTALPFLRAGWGLGEEHLAWIIDTSAQIELPAPHAPGVYMLRLDVWPAADPGTARAQEVSIVLDRIVIGQFSLDEPTTLVMPLPRELTEGRNSLPVNIIPRDRPRRGDRGAASNTPTLCVAVSQMSVVPMPAGVARVDSLRMDQGQSEPPRAVSRQFLTEDASTLAAAIQTALDVDTRALALHFESLGDNREFGIVQRKLGLEVLNLFRFAISHPSDLIRALNDDLQALTDPESLTVELHDGDPREYVLKAPGYNLCWHTFRFESEAEQQTVWRDHATRLGYLRRKFYDGLRAGHKIYVMKQQRHIPTAQATALLMELNRHGKATLLCVEPAPPRRRPGEVELLMPGLMRGYVEQFAADPDVEAVDCTDWLRVLANATLLQRASAASVDI